MAVLPDKEPRLLVPGNDADRKDRECEGAVEEHPSGFEGY